VADRLDLDDFRDFDVTDLPHAEDGGRRTDDGKLPYQLCPPSSGLCRPL
jgi:hypothetical protein